MRERFGRFDDFCTLFWGEMDMEHEGYCLVCDNFLTRGEYLFCSFECEIDYALGKNKVDGAVSDRVMGSVREGKGPEQVYEDCAGRLYQEYAEELYQEHLREQKVGC